MEPKLRVDYAYVPKSLKFGGIIGNREDQEAVEFEVLWRIYYFSSVVNIINVINT
jgi:hypothetical protein